jgi:hypothetical protein
MPTSEPEIADVSVMTTRLVEEVFNALGFSKTGFACKYFGWTLRPIAKRLAVMLVPIDQDLGKYGSQVAARNFLPPFVNEIKSRGAESIPTTGPIIVASNHPGAYDSMAIVSQIPRPDATFIISDIPLVKFMPNASKHAYFATSDSSTRTNAVRETIRLLERGGCLVIFATGLIDPDPEVWGEEAANLEIEGWSSSLELFLKKVPETKLVVTIASGVLDPVWAKSKSIRIAKPGLERRRLAEFGQVISQLLRPGRKKYNPHISFAPPVTLDDLGHGRGEAMPNIKARARALLAEHMANQW